MTDCPAASDAAANRDRIDFRAIEELDVLRCSLISDGNLEGFRHLLTSDYVHVHAMGRADLVDETVETFRRSPRTCSRPDLHTRLYGDIAVVTGVQESTFGRGDGVRRMSMQVTTVVRRMTDGWKYVSFHGTTIL